MKIQKFVVTITTLLLFNTLLIFGLNTKVESQETSQDFNAKLIISEFMANPDGSDTIYEWIEIQNIAEDVVNLEGWILDGKNLPSYNLEVNEYLVIAKDKIKLQERYPDLLNVMELNISLKNSSDQIVLKNDQFIDEINYSSSIEAVSWERINNCSTDIEYHPESNSIGSINANFEEYYCQQDMDIDVLCSLNGIDFDSSCSGFIGEKIFVNITNSENNIFEIENAEYIEQNIFLLELNNPQSNTFKIRNTENSFEQELNIQTYPRIYLNEIMPNPDGSDSGNEWVELYTHESISSPLQNWILADNSSEQILPELDLSNKFEVLNPSFSLNNTEDSISLYTPSGLISDTFSYTSTVSGQSYSKSIDGIGEWVDNYKITRGTNNEPYENNYLDIISITEAKNSELDTIVSVEGIVISEIDQLGSNNFYIQDDTSGIKIYLHSNISDMFNFEIGDKLRIEGTLQESRGELQIRVDSENSLNRISTDNEIKVFSSKDNIGANEGELIKIEGEIIQNSGSTFYVLDPNNNNEYKVSILDSTGIEGLEKSKGDKVKITGIVSQWGDDNDGKPNMRFLPRFLEDIIFLKEDTNKDTKGVKSDINFDDSKSNLIQYPQLANDLTSVPEVFELPEAKISELSPGITDSERDLDNNLYLLLILSTLFTVYSSYNILSKSENVIKLKRVLEKL